MSQENDYKAEEAQEEEFDTQDEVEEVEDTEEDDSEDIDWKARALKAEEAIIKSKKDSKQSKKPAKSKTDNKDTKLELQKLLLEDKGFNEEKIALAEEIAKLKGISLLKATKDEYFQFSLKKDEEKESSQKASTGASRRGRVIKRGIEDIKRDFIAGKTISSEERQKLIFDKYKSK